MLKITINCQIEQKVEKFKCQRISTKIFYAHVYRNDYVEKYWIKNILKTINDIYSWNFGELLQMAFQLNCIASDLEHIVTPCFISKHTFFDTQNSKILHIELTNKNCGLENENTKLNIFSENGIHNP